MNIQTVIVGILFFAPTLAFADAPFEDVHIVEKAKKSRGYRGNNGDLLQMKDGSVLFCYTEYGESGGITAKRSSDKAAQFRQMKTPLRRGLA